MKIVAFDPSMTCVGWAVLSREHGDLDHGILLEAGTIRTDELETADTIGRLQLIAKETAAMIDEHEPSIVAVELPSTFVPSQGRGMQRRGQPTYGMAVGVVIAATSTPRTSKYGRITTPPRVIGWPPDVWTRALPPEARRTSDDKNKTRRVAHAARIYQRTPESFGPKTRAGDIADAVLVGWYAMLTTAREGIMAQWKAGA